MFPSPVRVPPLIDPFSARSVMSVRVSAARAVRPVTTTRGSMSRTSPPSSATSPSILGASSGPVIDSFGVSRPAVDMPALRTNGVSMPEDAERRTRPAPVPRLDASEAVLQDDARRDSLGDGKSGELQVEPRQGEVAGGARQVR